MQESVERKGKCFIVGECRYAVAKFECIKSDYQVKESFLD